MGKSSSFFRFQKRHQKEKKLWTDPLFYSYRVPKPKKKKGDRLQTPDMCVISKNYLLYVKRQIHGWREFFSYYSQNDGSREREREGLTNDDDAQTNTTLKEEVPEAWA